MPSIIHHPNIRPEGLYVEIEYPGAHYTHSLPADELEEWCLQTLMEVRETRLMAGIALRSIRKQIDLNTREE